MSLVLLVSPASLPSNRPPSLVEPESGAWAVVHAGQLWVCWTPGPDCFARIEFDEAPRREDPLAEDDHEAPELAHASTAPEFGIEASQIGFWGPRSLWIERGEARFRVLAGQRRARAVDEPAPIRLRRIAAAPCGPEGLVPAVIGGRLSWREAPRCAVERATAGAIGARRCMSAPGPRLRPPTPLRLRAGVEIVGARAWTAEDDAALALAIAGRRRSSAVELSFVVEVGFDLQRRAVERRTRALLARSGRAQLRELPPVPPGPRAAAEIDALAELLCAGGPR